MIKFTPYFYKFKDMLLDSRIPVEYRAMYLEERGFGALWKRHYNFHMYSDDSLEVSSGSYYQKWKQSLWYLLKKVTVKDVSSILDMELKHPELSPSDLITALILWGRGPAIVKTILDLNKDMPEYGEFKSILDEAKSWRKFKKTLPKNPGWLYRQKKLKGWF